MQITVPCLECPFMTMSGEDANSCLCWVSVTSERLYDLQIDGDCLHSNLGSITTQLCAIVWDTKIICASSSQLLNGDKRIVWKILYIYIYISVSISITNSIFISIYNLEYFSQIKNVIIPAIIIGQASFASYAWSFWILITILWGRSFNFHHFKGVRLRFQETNLPKAS